MHGHPDRPLANKYTAIYYSNVDDMVIYDDHTYTYVFYECGCISGTPIGMYREENGKTYFRKNPDYQAKDEEEYLTYDWNLPIGDTVFVQSDDADNSLILKTIEDVMMHGETRCQFLFSYLSVSDSTELWIEGMAANSDFLSAEPSSSRLLL